MRNSSGRAAAMKNGWIGSAKMQVIQRYPTSGAALSREAKTRLRWFDWHQQHGRNVSLTCRHFGISRQTFYRWQGRYNGRDLTVLEARSSRPLRVRQPSWTPEQALAVEQLRQRFPRWGKDKLQVVLAREGIPLSVSMVGRILTQLKARGGLQLPLQYISTRKRRLRREYGVRKPRGYLVQQPGDLVQLDTLDVRLMPAAVFKHFTARDVVSRWDVLGVRASATANTAADHLEAIVQRMPFPVRAIQVDGGSEFMAGFEQACKAKGIRLFVLPPRSPKLNGCVERAQRTHTEEFYECTSADATVPALAEELRRWEDIYNTYRPHQALGQLTPLEWLNQHHEKEAVSPRC